MKEKKDFGCVSHPGIAGSFLAAIRQNKNRRHMPQLFGSVYLSAGGSILVSGVAKEAQGKVRPHLCVGILPNGQIRPIHSKSSAFDLHPKHQAAQRETEE